MEPDTIASLRANLRILISQASRIALVLFAVSAALWAINFVSLLFAPCVQPQIVRQSENAEKDTDKEHACPERRGIVSTGLYEITNWTPESWTAAGTIMLALSTLVLAITTRRQVQLARDEFIATHRPRLRVRSVWLTTDIAADQVAQGRLTIVNAGDGRSKITGCFGDVACRSNGTFGDGRPNINYRQTVNKTVLDPGEPDEITITSYDRMSADDYARYNAEDAEICIVGRITYADLNKVNRTTGFFRIHRQQRKYCVKADEPDYEYED